MHSNNYLYCSSCYVHINPLNYKIRALIEVKFTFVLKLLSQKLLRPTVQLLPS